MLAVGTRHKLNVMPDRLLDLLLMKKDVANHLLTEKLEMLTVSVEVKSMLRDMLSTVAAYRSGMGEPHFNPDTGTVVLGVMPDQMDLTWRGAVGLLGKMFLEFVEAGYQVQ